MMSVRTNIRRGKEWKEKDIMSEGGREEKMGRGENRHYPKRGT
jgi:hypothetical protein